MTTIPKCVCFVCEEWLSPQKYVLLPRTSPDGKPYKIYVCLKCFDEVPGLD